MGARLTVEYDLIASGYRRRPWPIVCKAVKESTSWFADLGSGPGQNATYIAALKSDLKGILVDISLEMLMKFLKQHAEGHLHRLHPVLADMEFPPLRSESLDSILLISSLHHIMPRDSRLEVLRECHRILRGHGLLLTVVWSRWQPMLVLKVLRDFHSYILCRKESPWDLTRCSKTTCRRYHLYSLGELARDLRDAGFKVIERGVYRPQEGGEAPSKNYYCLSVKG
ncbi:MAG: class I SAM-dependent methyltransferase [Zestosphaera sp.]